MKACPYSITLVAFAGIVLVSQSICLGETRDKNGNPSDLISFQASFVNDATPAGQNIKVRRGEIVRPPHHRHTQDGLSHLPRDEGAGDSGNIRPDPIELCRQ